VRFVCDFDGIAYPFVSGVATHPSAERLALENCWTWETPIEIAGPAWPEALAHGLSYETMRAVGLFPDFKPAMERLRAVGVVPLLRTHRPPDALAAVQRLLAEEGLGWLDVAAATPQEKIDLCLAEGISVLVDDHPQTLAAAHAAGLRAMALRFPYNSEMIERLGVEEAPDWDVLAGLILAVLRAEPGRPE
jgi:hypothetical protein